MIRRLLQNPAGIGRGCAETAPTPLAPRADRATSGDVRLVTSGKVRLLCIAAGWIINGDVAVELVVVGLAAVAQGELEVILGIIELGVELGILEIDVIILKFPEVVVPPCPP